MAKKKPTGGIEPSPERLEAGYSTAEVHRHHGSQSRFGEKKDIRCSIAVKKKNYPAVKIHPGKFEDEPQKFFTNQPKFSRFVLKFSRMYFYSRIIFFLTPTLVNHAKSDWPQAQSP